MTLKSKEIHIPAKMVRSLCWDGDSLVDWVAGGNRYFLDGTAQERHVSYSYRFDAAVISPSGEYAAIYTRTGTKGLILNNGKIVREINRSFYYAHAYEYPIVLLRLPSGQEVIAHCPEHYNLLQIEDLASGEALIGSAERKPKDFFFSRLSADDNGAFLASAGWHWHPVDHVEAFRIAAGLGAPSHFDEGGLDIDTWGENSSACFSKEGSLVVSLWDDDFGKVGPEQEENSSQRTGELRVFDLVEAKMISSVRPATETGTIMAVGATHIVAFLHHPKLISLDTGEVVMSWDEIDSGEQRSSIIWDKILPPLALDPGGQRFAVASEDEIIVVKLLEQLE